MPVTIFKPQWQTQVVETEITGPQDLKHSLCGPSEQSFPEITLFINVVNGEEPAFQSLTTWVQISALLCLAV